MDKNNFLRIIRSHPGWKNMTQKGSAGISVFFGNVEFLIFRDAASHYLRAVPKNQTTLAVVRAFNTLINSCRKELSAEISQWNKARLYRDDNEGDR